MSTPAMSTPVQKIVHEELARFKARLKWREDDTRLELIDAVLSGDDARASQLLPVIQELVALGGSVGTQIPAAVASISPQPSTPALPEPQVPPPSGRRVFGFRVLVGDKTIQGHTDACTFADAIQALGCSAVAELRLIANYCPLVSRERQRPTYGGYRRNMQLRQRGEWYIVTHSSTSRKARLLREIAGRLRVELVIQTSWIAAT